MYVIGTAGHVDHGKSTLVQALTGIDPDRLREEKEREMTIDLGFAWLTLANGDAVGFVDVPGHRDFIENMLAGVGGIDAVLLIVAADEGIMPQTREHLAILDLLEVETGIVVLTKTDLAESEEWIELVIADICDTLEDTSLRDAPIVRVSATEGRGIQELQDRIQEMLAGIDARPDTGHPRLPIDRVFTISGFGTVVTGTLIEGSFHTGQEVEILPPHRKARIRGLQTHKQPVERAVPGSRVAMNLTGVDKDEVQRGFVVTTSGWLQSTTLVDARLRYLPGSHRPLRHNSRLKFFTGAAETVARVRLLGQERVQPGEWGWVQLELQDPITLVNGDRFIVRLPSPPATVGGGVIVDAHPRRRHRRYRDETVERLETLLEGDPAEILLQHMEKRKGPQPVKELLASSHGGDAGPEALRELLTRDDVLVLGDEASALLQAGDQEIMRSRALIASLVWWMWFISKVLDELSDYHARHPLRGGMPREALRSRLELDQRPFNAAIAQAVEEGEIAEDAALVRLASHKVQLDNEQTQRTDALMARFTQTPNTPPSVKESVEAIGPDVLNVLIDRGQLMQISEDVLLLPDTYQAMAAGIQEFITSHGEITLAEARDLFGTSRKYAQALLEYMDSRGITRRVGDVRILRT